MQPFPPLYPGGIPAARPTAFPYNSTLRPAPGLTPLYPPSSCSPVPPTYVNPTIKLDLSPLNELMKQYTQFARQQSWFPPITPLRGSLVGGVGLASLACLFHGTLEATLMNGILGTIAGATIAAGLRKKNTGHSGK